MEYAWLLNWEKGDAKGGLGEAACTMEVLEL